MDLHLQLGYVVIALAFNVAGVPIYATCEVLTKSLINYCSTLGASPAPGAPNWAQEICVGIKTVLPKKYRFSAAIYVNGGGVFRVDENTAQSVSGPFNDILFDIPTTPYIYPAGGAYGANVLNRDNTNITSGNFSMHADIPDGKVLRVKITGSFAYVLNHPTDSDWTWTQSGGGADLTVDFTSTHSGAVDFHLLSNSGGVSIEVYENGDTTPTWTR